MKALLAFVLVTAISLNSFAYPSYTGRSGAPTRQTCASSCHGSSGGTVQISGFPAVYEPGQNYLLTIQRLTGGSIVNFNASCRVGTGTTNAGVISSGEHTATYNVNGETNGVHLSSNGFASATFNWTAPPAGTGTVRLYCGALQSSENGPNSTLVLVSNETSALPGMATLPNPANHAVEVPLTATLSWAAGAGATSHDLYFGNANPPDFVVNQTAVTFDLPGDLDDDITYYWRIDERNAAGVTPGEVWDFTVVSLPTPDPATELTIRPIGNSLRLRWNAADGAVEYRIYRDTIPNIQMDAQHRIATSITTSFTDSGAVMLAPQFFYLVTASN